MSRMNTELDSENIGNKVVGCMCVVNVVSVRNLALFQVRFRKCQMYAKDIKTDLKQLLVDVSLITPVWVGLQKSYSHLGLVVSRLINNS